MLAKFLNDVFRSGDMPPRADCRGKLTVGIAAYGNSHVTAFALKCLFSALRGDFELILVDDNSPDDTLELFRSVAAEHRNTQLFHFPENKEYSGSLNAILSHATRESVLFLSNDVFVTPSYFRGLADVSSLDEDYGIVRGVSNFCDDQLPVHNVPTPLACGRDIKSLFRFAAEVARRHASGVAVDSYLTGDAFLVRRPLLDRIGAIDTSLFGYFADIDFGVRARIAGFKQATALGAFAYHSQDANLNFLSPVDHKAKLERRFTRVYAAWDKFYAKYAAAIPEGSRYSKISSLPWDSLSDTEYVAARHYVAPSDYSAFRVR
jgi:GT2 family glycosyltransferase